MTSCESEEREWQRRQDHIEELREKIDKLSGGQALTYASPCCPDEVTEKFLESVLAFEEGKEEALIDALVAAGIELPAPKDLDDGRLTAKLWEVIRGMELLGHYLHHTDHLSDRELYERLWTDTLREPTTMIPENPNFACHIDLVGSGSEEDLHLYLKHYADEDEREDWAAQWPEDNIPEHEDPPCDRDRLLPGSWQ